MPRKRDASVYIIKGIDADVWRRFKARAAREGHPLKWLMSRFITAYADELRITVEPPPIDERED